MDTWHKIITGNAQNLKEIPDNTVNLVVTSPPYPMVEMWDKLFSNLNPKIKKELDNNNGLQAYELMHQELDKVWNEIDRVLNPTGGIICINIGDATRKIRDTFQIYQNHARIIQTFQKLGYETLPSIIWRKKANKPNKFMGSGMLPVNAYVTLEHEYILIFRKGGNRKFQTKNERENRKQSAYFIEERNKWFTDTWEDIKGRKQNLGEKGLRERNGAYPLEIPYRLINMYSVKGDTVLDPFLGTGTTSIAALTLQRNSIGYEIDPKFKPHIIKNILNSKEKANKTITERLKNHKDKLTSKKHYNHYLKCNVHTKQETNIQFNKINKIKLNKNNNITVKYNEINTR